jgi:double-stranded uracil-DNA glycosylase
MGFTREQLETFRDCVVPDLIGPGVMILFVGINPGLWTAAVQTHFAHPGNRFYPALYLAGIIDRPIDRKRGMSEGDRDHLIARGVGITNLVDRATVRASELGKAELIVGAERLEHTVAAHGPRVVAVAGITAYRMAFGIPRATLGRQPLSISGAAVWVVPNPSGLNAHETTETLAAAYRSPAIEAGVVAA